ncbi:unnamed protein product, partial [Prunus brigantina]
MGIELWVWGKSLGSLDGLGDEEVRWEERRVHLEGEKLTVAVILGGGLMARVEGGEELGFWVHGAWGGGWLLDGFGWRVVVGWVWGLELKSGGHGGMEKIFFF